ncbi:MAG: MFS transporter, partial [Gemmatimonadetes bacterium]|nr:MFS transporter [Gemmatimonadota bacterium]
RKRGLAMGLASLGFSLSMAVHPTFSQWLIDEAGWRQAWLWLGVSTWVLLVPCAALLVRNRPEDLGLAPDGDRGGSAAKADEPGDSAEAGLTLGEAMRTSAFWICAVAVATLSLAITAIFFHQVSILESRGLSPGDASRVFAVSAVAMVAFMPVFGRLLDRLRTQTVFAGGLLLISCSLGALAAVSGTLSAVFFGIVFGIANAGSHNLLAYIWPRFFGRRHLGSIQGASQTVSVLGASIGPIPFGLAWDLYGSYTGALSAFALLPLLCAVAVWFIREPGRTPRA